MNSSGVRTPRVRKAEDLRVGVTHSRADLRLERMDGMVVVIAIVRICVRMQECGR